MITLTTCQTYPDLPQNLFPLLQRLQAKGYDTQVLPWQQTMQTMQRDLILPFCAWDYSSQPEQFSRWIDKHSSHFLNSAQLMRWNMCKSYLLDLARWGVDVIPTLLISDIQRENISSILTQQSWQTAVLKPAIGQSGKNVIKLTALDVPDLTNIQGYWILQPFISEVVTNGETSLIFFNGEFSHSVRRQPAVNEWRANSAYGVQIIPCQPNDIIITQAQNVLKKLPEMPVYARVDGTIIGERFLLNELELIEPALYLDRANGATERLSVAIETRLNSPSQYTLRARIHRGASLSGKSD